MRLRSYFNPNKGFTLAEILIAIAVVVLFGMAAFASNARLMFMLKSQREETAATMMLQERMENFRALGYSDLASTTLSATTNPPTTAADIVANSTLSEAQIGGGITGTLSETITVSGYMDTSGNCPVSSPAQNRWVRNATYPTGNLATSSTTLASVYDLLQVDIQLSWTGPNRRTRTREIKTTVGKGNKGS